MKRFSIITFIVAMVMLSVGCSTDGKTTKADPEGIVFTDWIQHSIPILCYTVDVSTEIPDIIYVETNFSEIVYSNVNDNSIDISINDDPLSEFIFIWDESVLFAEIPDIINNIGTNKYLIDLNEFTYIYNYNPTGHNWNKQKFRHSYSKKC